jgi:uncharacterized protein YecE (DUF72 family)
MIEGGPVSVDEPSVKVFGYANNHYAGHAPATIRQFRELWRGKSLPELAQPQRKQQEGSLFDL